MSVSQISFLSFALAQQSEPAAPECTPAADAANPSAGLVAQPLSVQGCTRRHWVEVSGSNGSYDVPCSSDDEASIVARGLRCRGTRTRACSAPVGVHA